MKMTVVAADAGVQSVCSPSPGHASSPVTLTSEGFLALGSISIKNAVQEDGKENELL